MKVSLTCALVGEVKSVFDVDIDDGKKVTKLKEAIKAEESEMIKCEADKMQLFLAKKGKAWLDWAEAAAVTLDEDGYLQGFEEMNLTLFVKDPKNFGEKFQPGEGKVHDSLIFHAMR
ncbi:hypothetical protein PF002_g21021 [Phytophthora fragariae]|uniref:Crinkler effector protein N-terminal domain-containing protein n=1 Tax=Phytophthora fragariae TaxID=53985 RepID=A0A6A3XPN2_9STRA|nr:hypothetical protein PF002_g21021 [Phytophthora fragariae]